MLGVPAEIRHRCAREAATGGENGLVGMGVGGCFDDDVVRVPQHCSAHQRDGVLGADGDHDLFGGCRGAESAVALRDLFPEMPFPDEVEARVRHDGRRGFTGAA